MSFTTLSPAKRKLLAGAAAKELACRSLLDFAARLIPSYKTPPHIRLIAEHLERLERRDICRLRISLPPRAGKTLLAVKLFVAWYIGRHPEHEVACCSYNEDTASVSTRQIRDYLSDERYPFETRIRSDSSAAYRMNTTQGGAIIAAGITSSLTGRGAHVLVLDDMAKDYASATSETVTQAVLDWYMTVASTRLYPDSIVLCIGTRWSERDLQQTIIDDDDGEWTHLVLPAVCEEEGDPLGRAIGDVLWPDVFTPEFVAKQKQTLGSDHFSALYQCSPVPRGGSLFKIDWFSQRYDPNALPSGVPTIVPWQSGVWQAPLVAPPLLKILAVDGSWAKTLHSDYSAFVVVGTDGSRIYVLDVWRNRLQLPELERALLAMYVKHRPESIVIEAAASGDALIASLRRTLLPIVASRPQGTSKEARWQAIAPLCEAGRVLLPREAQWLPMFLKEMLTVPASRHDDMVDAFALAVSNVMRCQYHRAAENALAQALAQVSLAP